MFIKKIISINKSNLINSNLINSNSFQYRKLSKRTLFPNISPRYKYDSKYSYEIKQIIDETFKNTKEIPTVIGGNKIFSNLSNKQQSPIDNTQVVCKYNETDYNTFVQYLNEFKYYKKSLSKLTNNDKNSIFKKARELLSTKYRDQMTAYTILGQGKSIYESDIDSICELGDFLNYNNHYYNEIVSRQPISVEGVKNISRYNALNGFVAAVTPFNFTAIGGNLASLPTLFGNSVIWKPSDKSILSNYLFYEILIEAGLPDEAITFTPCNHNIFKDVILSNEELGGLLFTGSSKVFSDLYSKIGKNIDTYKNYPRLIGETGGKNFHFIHSDLNGLSLSDIATKTVQSAYGYSGQKCSACSIVYVPKSVYSNFLKEFKIALDHFKNSNAYDNYTVINSQSYHRIKHLINNFKKESYYIFLEGGDVFCDKKNYYIEPTLIQCQKPGDTIFSTEFFGPVLALYCYDDYKLNETMNICKLSSKYGLTGSVFSGNDNFINHSIDFFKEKCGNFYINDKSTGSVVGQQPFGGSCKSGTNDKAGDINLLYRLFNQQNIKVNLEAKSN